MVSSHNNDSIDIKHITIVLLQETSTSYTLRLKTFKYGTAETHMDQPQHYHINNINSSCRDDQELLPVAAECSYRRSLLVEAEPQQANS